MFRKYVLLFLEVWFIYNLVFLFGFVFKESSFSCSFIFLDIVLMGLDIRFWVFIFSLLSCRFEVIFFLLDVRKKFFLFFIFGVGMVV